MPFLLANIAGATTGFTIKGMMRYNVFVPRLYNFCKSLGFEAGKIMPSRAFCSDENQGYPIIMLTKHFGTFPFNHGRGGGIVATDRHGPHADHGRDLVIIQASHVGYDPATKTFGQYRRMQIVQTASTPSCGKLYSIMDWYEQEYQFAQDNIFIDRQGDALFITIDNQLLNSEREEGLFLHLDKLVHNAHESLDSPLHTFSTARSYPLAPYLQDLLQGLSFQEDKVVVLGKYLTPDLFYFKRHICEQEADSHHLEKNLVKYMPAIITSAMPSLAAAQITTQIEFDRTFRSIVKEKSFKGKRLVFISGLHIDISPQEDNVFPLTKFVPWAAYIQDADGSHRTMEQDELIEELARHSIDNPDQIDLEAAIAAMASAEEVHIDH